MGRVDPEKAPTATLLPDDKGPLKNEKQSRSGDVYEHDPEMAGLDLLERKMILVNRALNSMGMGRYQWCLFVLCGFGYLMDLAFAQMFGLILSPLTIELGVAVEDQGTINSCFNAGLCVGAFVWGILIDVIGRKWAFNASLFVCSFFGLFLGVPSNYGAICAIALLCGLGLGGNIPIDATIALEFLPARKRWLLIVLSSFQPLGVLLCSLIAWGLIPPRTCDIDAAFCGAVAAGEACCTKSENYGWRLTAYTIGAITMGLFLIRFVVFNFRESPKFLLIKGRDQEAIDVIHSVAKFNKIPEHEVTVSMDQFRQLEATASQISSGGPPEPPTAKKWFNLSHFRIMFSSRKSIYITLLIFAIYILDYWSFSLAGSFLPLILREKGADLNISVNETYRNYIIQAVCGLPGVALGAVLCELKWLGQRYSLFITGTLMGVSLFLFAIADSQPKNVAFNTLEYFFQSAFNAILYGSAPLYFHTAIRGTGVGTASTLGRLFSIIAPIIGAHIRAGTGTNDVLYTAGGPMLGCALLCLLLPNIKKGHVY